MVRNFVTTAPLLCTAWAQTPHQLVSEIRYQASLPIKPGLSWQLTAGNGTHLEGIVLPVRHFSKSQTVNDYSVGCEKGAFYFPWPE